MSYNLPPAPPRNRPLTAKCDLGDIDPEYAGRIVIFRRNVPMSQYKTILSVNDDNASQSQKIESLIAWLEGIVIAWNLTTEDTDGNSVAVRQPGDGGLWDIDQEEINVIARAYNTIIQPKN